MATGEELISGVKSHVMDDPSLDTDQVLSLLNTAQRDIASRLLLPALEAVGVVPTEVGENLASLPADYMHNLFAARVGSTEVRVVSSRAMMLRMFSDTSATGAVSAVAPVGSALMYCSTPAASTDIQIFYHRTPTDITERTEPDAFGPMIQHDGENLMRWYAAYRLYDDIEDGIEGKKANTLRYEALYYKGLNDLRLKLRESVSMAPPPIVKSSW